MAGACPGGFPVGALVALDPKERLVPLGPANEPVDLRGAKAQLLEWQEGRGWLVCTFEGLRVHVPREALRPLAQPELEALGAGLVLGPASSLPGLARQMSAMLSETGYATVHVVTAEAQRSEILEVVRSLDKDGLFSRLPSQFEAGYLGRGGKAKVASFETLVEERRSSSVEQLGAALPMQDTVLTELSHSLSPHLDEALGFSIYSRTNLMLRLSFADSEEESQCAPPESSNLKEADSFLSLMGRKRVCALHSLGPGSATLRLIPRAPEFGDVILRLPHNMLIVFLTDYYDYEYQPDGRSLALQSFFLVQPQVFQFQSRGAVELSPEDLPPARGPGLPAGEPVCVAGMASRDPCYVDDHEKLWTALRHGGCDGFLEIPYTRFDVDLYIQYDDQAAAVQNGKSYCRHQGHCEGIEIFDSAFFNVPAAECYGMDPEQRIVMETGWLAMSEAGYERRKVQKESAHLGVFVGISGSDWRDVVTAPSPNGVPETFIANRFSYVINLKGPSLISNTACSASLVATHSAKVHLLFPTDPLDGCVVCGVSLNLSPGTWAGNCSGNMLSFLGRSFSFNSTADGYGRGEGCAAAVIKRSEYDPTDPLTYALLAGTHTNSDGRSASLTAPNGPAQQRLLRAILTETQLEASEICVYEAHGTGTSLGDPIEVGAVRKVLVQREYPIMVSCSKTNLGHLEGGAGLSSFCKCVMACMHTECAPNQHLNLQNPHLDIEGWPALLLTEASTMKADTTYVGVSGFGYGGTNSHALTYGRNVVTSRGGVNPEHREAALLRKVKAAAPEISMEGDSYEEWVSTGAPHLNRDHGKTYRVAVLDEGQVVWEEVIEPGLADAQDFQIQGSFTDWQMLSLEPSGEEPGLFYCSECVLGPTGEELFQIAVEYDPYMILYPEMERCIRKAARILGPAEPPSREHAWLIRGDPGSRYRIEFFHYGSTASVTWQKCSEEVVRLTLGQEEIQE